MSALGYGMLGVGLACMFGALVPGRDLLAIRRPPTPGSIGELTPDGVGGNVHVTLTDVMLPMFDATKRGNVVVVPVLPGSVRTDPDFRTWQEAGQPPALFPGRATTEIALLRLKNPSVERLRELNNATSIRVLVANSFNNEIGLLQKTAISLEYPRAKVAKCLVLVLPDQGKILESFVLCSLFAVGGVGGGIAILRSERKQRARRAGAASSFAPGGPATTDPHGSAGSSFAVPELRDATPAAPPTTRDLLARQPLVGEHPAAAPVRPPDR